MMVRRCLLAWMAVAALAMPAAADERPDQRVNADRHGIAILGYDPVAYFTHDRPVKGSPEISYRWQDKEWHFASPEHRASFAAEPRRYAPRFGGFCAGAMALGWRAPIDPEAFSIIDGRLYLAYDRAGIDEFTQNAATDIPKAEKNWERLGVPSN